VLPALAYCGSGRLVEVYDLCRSCSLRSLAGVRSFGFDTGVGALDRFALAFCFCLIDLTVVFGFWLRYEYDGGE
jgi:hypothetical protein